MEKEVKDIYTQEFSASHAKNRQTDSAHKHFHEEIELFFHIRGGKACLIDDRVVTIQPYDLILFNPNQIHKIVRNEDEVFERYIMLAKTSFLTAFEEDNEIMRSFYAANLSGMSVVSPDETERNRLLCMFGEYFHLTGYARKTMEKVMFIRLMAYVSELFDQHLQQYDALQVNRRIEPVLQYINAHFTEMEFGLDAVAEQFHFTKPYLCSLFKKYTSMTVNSYLVNKRIIYAKELLKTDCTISECAQNAGFADYSNFIRVFKKYVGISPKKYQLQNIRRLEVAVVEKTADFEP